MPTRNVGEGGGNTDRLLGELIAEVRTVKHGQQNAELKLDGINHLVEQVKEMKVEQDKHHFRIAVLEADKNRREGAVGLVEWLGKNWPMIGGLIALVVWVGLANGLFK